VKKPAYAKHGATRGTLVTTRLPPDLVDQIDALGKAEDITRSGATRRAIEVGLRKLNPKARKRVKP
jgi:predicted transcriptional regulator